MPRAWSLPPFSRTDKVTARPLKDKRFSPPWLCRAGNRQGFTLLEIVLTLAILGVIGAMAGVGILQVTKGFVFSRQNSETAGKAQLAMLRLAKECMVITSVASGSSSAITFTAQHGSSSTKTYTVSVTNSVLTMNDGATDDALLDNVTAFSLNYYDTYDGSAASSWSASSTIIEISITVTGAENVSSTFTTRIRPRNI